ncbi:hypothetical protein SAMN02745866_02264 [Alteromonadaceae bacterium Bs31]|nr:hypothetical protein SAMN02745866_02264 [Alteromonadaceae bacterium Bs31]
MRANFFTFLLLFTLPALALAKPLDVSSLADVETSFRGDPDEQRDILLRKLRKQEQPNVILLPIESKWGEESATAATNAITSVLIKNKITLIDRSVSEQLRDELIAIEKGGISRGSSYDLGDYAIRGQVLTITSQTLFHPAKKDALMGMDFPDRCEVKINTSIQITLYNMNPLEVQKEFVLEDNYSNTYNNVRKCAEVNDAQDRLKAIGKNIEGRANKVANLFVSEGYIIGHRSYKKSGKNRHIFKTHLKKSTGGYKKGSKVKVIEKVERIDPVLGTTETQIKTVAEGKIIETTGDDYVWFELSKKQDPSKVFIGDSVDIKLKEKSNNPFEALTKSLPGFK